MTPINPTTTPLLGITLSASSSRNLQWQPGQTLTATVMEVQADGKLRLQLLGQIVEARSLLPLTKGQQLQVLVEVAANRVMLRLLEPSSTETAVTQAWRNALPKQQPLATVLQAIARLAQSIPLTTTNQAAGTTTPTAPPSLPPVSPAVQAGNQSVQQAAPSDRGAATGSTPPPLPELARQLLQRLTPLSQLATADGLRRALLNAGPLLESRLALGDSAALDEDFQAALLRLLGLVKPERSGSAAATATKAAHTSQQQPPTLLMELGEQLESAVARIKVQQLHSLSAQAGTEPAWLFELPLRNQQEPEVLRLRIQREAAKEEGGRGGWSVRLHFEDANHGTYDTLVSLTGQKVGVNFWSERPDTSRLFTQRIDELRSRLQQAGLEIEHLHSTVGKGPTDEAAPPSGLLSIKA